MKTSKIGIRYMFKNVIADAYYTYGIFHNREIIYVGKGTTRYEGDRGWPRQRCEDHFNKWPNNKHFNRRLRKYKDDVFIIKISKSFSSNEEANNHEKYLIAKYKSRNLCNIASGGDGGVTHKGTKRYFLPDENRFLFSVRKPKNAIYKKMPFKHNVHAYNPETGERRRFRKKSEIPDGFIHGLMPGAGYGPDKGTVVINNGSVHKYVGADDKIPRGWKRGRIRGSTEGKKAWRNTETGRVVFTKRRPKGPYEKATFGKAVVVEGKKYISMKEACAALGKSFSTVQKMVNGTYRPPNTIPVNYKGRQYSSIAEAHRTLGVSRYKFMQMMESENA